VKLNRQTAKLSPLLVIALALAGGSVFTHAAQPTAPLFFVGHNFGDSVVHQRDKPDAKLELAGTGRFGAVRNRRDLHDRAAHD